MIDNGAFDISGVTAGGASIQSLAGGRSVALGANTLTITAANDTFAGSITGSGGLSVTGGAETPTGSSNYTGVTTVDGGTLTLQNGGHITGNASATLRGTNAVMNVTGAGSLLQTASVSIGSGTGNGVLNVQAGGSVTTTGIVSVDVGGGALSGTLNVSGAGLLVDAGEALRVSAGTSTTAGALNVTATHARIWSGGRRAGLTWPNRWLHVA